MIGVKNVTSMITLVTKQSSLVILLVLSLHTHITLSFAFPKTGDEPGTLGFHKNCPQGYELQHDRTTNLYECTCKKYHLYWPDDGLCYREFQQGPCQEGHR